MENIFEKLIKKLRLKKTSKFSGSVTIHFCNGVPKSFESVEKEKF